MPKIIPIQFRPDFSNYESLIHDDAFLNFMEPAWFTYHRWIQSIIKSKKCTFIEARKYLHTKYKLRVPSYHKARNSHYHLGLFMLQFEEWQFRRYNLKALAQKYAPTFYIEFYQKPYTLEDIFAKIDYFHFNELVAYLATFKRWDIIRSLKDDPIFGEEAQAECLSPEYLKDNPL